MKVLNILDCGKNYSLAHGTVKYISNITSYNQTAVVTCDEGYQIEGDPVITCQADGTWSDNTTCRAKLAEGNIYLLNNYYLHFFRPGTPFWGYLQTEQTQLLRRRMRRLIRVFTVCLYKLIWKMR